MNPMDREKERIRHKFSDVRNAIPRSKRQSASLAICRTLIKNSFVRKARTICVFFSLEGEVDLELFVEMLLKDGYTVTSPRVKNDEELELYEITSLNDVIKGAYGLLEPDFGCRKVTKSKVDLFIVPGICFDKKGFRIGWGMGYYDRFLEGVEAPKIGVAFSQQVIARVPHTSYDIPMDTVITEKSVIHERPF